MTEQRRQEVRYRHRLPPCPSYDVAGMERWLEALAAQGLMLAEEDAFFGFASFIETEPQQVRYRLEATPKEAGPLSDMVPEEEAAELNAFYGWDYVARRGDFFIYRCTDPTVRELHTDPAVQALALTKVKLRQGIRIGTLLFWLIVYPLLLTRGGLLLTVLKMRSWLSLLAVLSFGWTLVDAVLGYLSLRRTQKQLQHGVRSLAAGRTPHPVLYYGKRALQLVLNLLLIFLILRSWSQTVLRTELQPLEEYSRPLPFATLRDLAGEDSTHYSQTMAGMGQGINALQEWSDWLAPCCIDYCEYANVTLADGQVLSGGLYVDYFELANPTLAKLLMHELERRDRREPGCLPLELPLPEADAAAAYTGILGSPTLLLRSGSTVLRAYLHQFSESAPLPPEVWMASMALSLPKG